MGRKGFIAIAVGVVVLLGLGIWGSPRQAAQVIPAPETVGLKAFPSFSRDIQPYLIMNCSACHSEISLAAGGLKLDSYTGLMAGTQFGAVVIPEQPALSNLVTHLKREVEPNLWRKCNLAGIPPDSNQIQNIERWISQGAKAN